MYLFVKQLIFTKVGSEKGYLSISNEQKYFSYIIWSSVLETPGNSRSGSAFRGRTAFENIENLPNASVYTLSTIHDKNAEIKMTEAFENRIEILPKYSSNLVS